MENQNGAIFHSSDSHLVRLDRAQDHFLSELGVTKEEAFMEYRRPRIVSEARAWQMPSHLPRFIVFPRGGFRAGAPICAR